MTTVIRTSDPSSIRTAAKHLRQGGVVVFPTETSYGITADPANNKAVQTLFAVKGRSAEKALPFIAASIEQITKTAILPTAEKNYAQKQWPGPLTIILRKKAAFRSKALGGRRTIAIRVTSHPWARRLARVFGRPLIATSANRAGKPPAFSLNASRRALARSVPDDVLWVDGGRLPRSRPSTIVRWNGKNLEVIRHGAVRVRDR